MRRVAIAGLLVGLAGCGEKPPAALPDTGSKPAVETFYAGLIGRDPKRAYDVLDDASKRKVSAEQFRRLADQYAKNLGFTPDKVHVRNCEEQGDRATAHVVLAGPSHRYEDGITLRLTGDRWGVVLPDNFGRKAR